MTAQPIDTAKTHILHQVHAWCRGAAISDGKQLGPERSGMHKNCKVAIRSTKPIKVAPGIHVAVDQLIVCSCSCHVGPNQSMPVPTCTECKNDTTGEVDTERWMCLDRQLCDSRVEAQAAANPLVQQLRAARADGERIRAETRARKARDADRRSMMTNPEGAPAKAPRENKPPKPKVGRCQHCGDPTKGGLFVAGHDAKLKGTLQRIAIDESAPAQKRVGAIAEQLARGWHKGSFPDKLVAGIKGTGESAEDKAQSQKTQREAAVARYEKLREQAEALVAKGKDKVIELATKQRIGDPPAAS